MRTYTDGADTAGGDPLSAPDPAQRTTTTAEPWPNSPWLALMPTRAPATCRAPAAPLSCQVSPHTWVAACAGTASPKEAGPPLMFTGVRPPAAVAPVRSNVTASPGPHSPRSSYHCSSRAVDRSWASAGDRSSGPRPACSHAARAMDFRKVTGSGRRGGVGGHVRQVQHRVRAARRHRGHRPDPHRVRDTAPPRELQAGPDQRRPAVGGRADVEQPQGVGDHGGAATSRAVTRLR